MVECRRFAVGIFMIYVIVLEVLLLPVTWLHLGFSTRGSVGHIIAGDLHVSYIVINSCTVFETTCVSVKPAKLLVLQVIRPPSWISGARRRPTKPEVPPSESLTPQNIGVAVGISSLYALELDICLGYFYLPPHTLSGKHRKNGCREV